MFKWFWTIFSLGAPDVFGSQSRVTRNRKTTNPKTNIWDIFEQLWQTHDNQGIISLETQDISSF